MISTNDVKLWGSSELGAIEGLSLRAELPNVVNARKKAQLNVGFR